MSHCRKCPAEIWFCSTAAGEWMPIDAEPSDDGNLWIDGHDGEHPIVRVVDLLTPADAERHTPHWATCPAAEEFRS